MEDLKFIFSIDKDRSYEKTRKNMGLESKNVIGNWVQRGRVPKKHLKALAEEFGIEEHYFNKKLTAEEKEFLTYEILRQKRERQYEETHIVKYDENGEIMEVEPIVSQTEESKREEAEDYNVTKNKELIKDIANLMSEFEVEKVSHLRWLISQLINFVGTDIDKVEFVTQLLCGTIVATKKTDTLMRIGDKEAPPKEFFEILEQHIENHYNPKSDF